MYTKEDMILWSMINSLVVDIGKMEVLAFSPEYLFKVFQKSIELKNDDFEVNYKEKVAVLNHIEDCKDKEKIENLFGDEELLKSLELQVKEEKKMMLDKDIKFSTYFCLDFPTKLKKGKEPPYVIYYKGMLPKDIMLNEAISIVGTRYPDSKGIYEFTKEIIENLKERIHYNISGLALGSDTIGHEVCLEEGIKNIAILGQGLGTELYPLENKVLEQKILENKGAIVSELPPSIGVKAIYLLRRNRLQVYFADDILVLETGNKGGTITDRKSVV